VPIIALTASAFQEDRERAEQAGMNDFIAKPFEDRELVTKCLSWIRTSNNAPGQPTQENLPVSPPPEVNDDRFSKYSPDFLRSMLQIFLETAPPVFETLLTSLRNADWVQAKSSAHWLRGGASRMIAPELQRQLENIEAACVVDPVVIAGTETESLTWSFQEACQIAESWLEKDQTSHLTAWESGSG
jgi:CheY-like chemotaxis protein